jgi:hypothetical protein
MVDIIPKEAPKPSRGLNILFYFAIFLLILSIGGYFALNNFLEKAREEVAALELDLARAMTPEKISLEKEILASKNKIDNFSYLVGQHLKTSRIFEIIQKITHPQVWFSKFDFNSRQGELKISGETQNFETLGQQILILGDEEAINSVNLEKISITKEGKIDFDLLLSFKPDIFKK